MPDIRFLRRHSLPIASARALVEKAADVLADEYQLGSEWRGNTLHFQRAGVDGQIHVTGSQVRLEVTLGPLLKPLRSKLAGHIERYLDQYLPQPEPSGSEKKAARKRARKTT